MNTAIHQGNPVLTFGADYPEAQLIVILLHGRGSKAESMLSLADSLQVGGARFLIPQAADNRWYPQTAFGPLDVNEPDLSSAIMVIEDLVYQSQLEGFSDQQIVLGGFSQGACLAAEYAVRNPARYGGLFIFSGALIGPPGVTRELPGSFKHMPVFIGGSDVDPWISHKLLKNAAITFEQMGAGVTFETYPGLPHTVNGDEILQVKKMLQNVKNQVLLNNFTK
jgi:predicted esterase